jgi:flagellin
MALNSINTNVAAYFAQQNIGKANSMVSGSVGRLSSGNRIVRASDDVAAMSVGTSLRTTVSTLKMGLLNASQGTSMLQVADGALGKMQDMLLRQKALATQATSGSLTGAERGFLNQEFQNLTQEIDRLVQNTNFNGVNLLGGGLGAKLDLAATDANAATFTDGTVASTVAIQLFDVTDGTAAHGAAAGQMQLVQADGTTAATNNDFLTANSSLYGDVGQIKVSNVSTGVGGTLSVEINGTTYTGQFADGDTAVTVTNGNTRIRMGTTALDTTTAITLDAAVAATNASFDGMAFMHTGSLSGADFSGTSLAGVSGSMMIRTLDPSGVSIQNFQYVGGTSGANVLSVEINGETYTATGVADAIAATDTYNFTNGSGQGLEINMTGLTTGITDIFSSATDRANFINGLNIGFSTIGAGASFALGTEASDSLTVSIRAASSTALFGGQSLNISTAADAQAAGEALNAAIDMVTSIRSDVGAMMSRFDFATANIEIAMQNQDAARGTLLDTDVAAESSAYATAQVQLQAGIAVLAQANQLPQNLLKLIG